MANEPVNIKPAFDAEGYITYESLIVGAGLFAAGFLLYLRLTSHIGKMFATHHDALNKTVTALADKVDHMEAKFSTEVHALYKQQETRDRSTNQRIDSILMALGGKERKD